MKKTILTFGLISGCVSSLLMSLTVPFIDKIGNDNGEIIGYTGIVLSFLLVFFGIKSYRDNAAGGQITFGTAFTVGIAITLISCVFYVVTWEIVYFNFMHGFADQYAAAIAQKMIKQGATPAAIQAQLDQMHKYKQLLDNPFANAAMTFIEPFPVGLVITLISAAVLRKRPEPQTSGQPLPAAR
jgi:hypothetical protein